MKFPVSIKTIAQVQAERCRCGHQRRQHDRMASGGRVVGIGLGPPGKCLVENCDCGNFDDGADRGEVSK